MQPAVEKNRTLWEHISSLLFFTLSDKVKFSIKASLSMALAYLIPLSQGWEQASTAAITIMLIAAMGSVSESVQKGAMRVIGTIIGAIIGMTLIAVFPQDRTFFLLSLSIIVAIPLYLVRAYKGDPSIFMLTAMTMMMVFKNGEVDDVFIFGLDKTYMTIFGIMVYTMVGVFLWPVNMEDTTTSSAMKLSKTQLQLFLDRNATKKARVKSLDLLLEHEVLLENATMDTGSASIDMQQWHSMIHNYKNINAHLTLLSMHDQASYTDNMALYVSNFRSLESDIITLFEKIARAWEDQEEITLPEIVILECRRDKIKDLSHLERASLISDMEDMKKLHEDLRTLATKLNRIHSPLPTLFENEKIPQNRRFLWGDPEDIKGVIVTFIIFWAATFFWIAFNPPGGFMLVALATGLSVLTTFTPIKPSMLMLVFSLSFIFATFMYVAILPQLHYGWELGLFIFLYSFISFYFVPAKLSIFFLLGLFTFNITNTMYYDFSIFLLVLLMFYLFLILLQIFYYIPFSTKPEHLFLLLKKRFFKLSHAMLEKVRKDKSESALLLTKRAVYSNAHLMKTVKQMQLWASKIDDNYFDTLNKSLLMAFTQECEKFTYMLELLYQREMKMHENPLVKELLTQYDLPSLSDLFKEYALQKEVKEIDSFWKDEKMIVDKVEAYLTKVLSTIDFTLYSEEIICEFYKNISLRKNVWLSFFSCQKMMDELDFAVLERSRF